MSLQTDLDDAKRKYHLLVTGESVREFVDQNGEKVTFTAGNRADLWAYIQRLEAALGTGDPEVRRPARFVF